MSFDRRRKRRTGGKVRWFTLIAIAIVLVALLFEFQWVWGLLFLFWAAPSLVTGETFLVEPVHRAENPWLFWTIVMLWLSLSLVLIGLDIARLFT